MDCPSFYFTPADLIIVFVFVFLLMSVVMLVGFFRERIGWNKGRCSRCGCPWIFRGLRRGLRVYTCNCPDRELELGWPLSWLED